MVKRRSSLILRNKKGHPIYSREDIREQYCINRKEVEVLENARSLKFLGCFPNPQDSSPCTKNSSLLFSCIHKKKHHKSHHQNRRSSSDENIYAPPVEVISPSPYDTDRTCETDETRSKDDICSTDDEEYILSGFRKRPKTFYCDPNRSRDSDGSLVCQGSIRGRRKLESSASFGSQQSYNESEREFIARNIRRPSQLNISARSRNDRFQPSRSVDELNDAETTRRREVSDTGRAAKTPDISLDDRRQKHVSFDNGNLVRSNTVAGGLEDVGSDYRGGPAATSTPLNSQRRSFSPPPRRNRSQERLLDGFVTTRPPLEFSDRSSSALSTSRQYDSSGGYRGLQRTHRALMKTQATQTELTFKARFLLPAYLTLSPRATMPQLLPVNQYPPCQRPHRSKTTSRHRAASSSAGGVRSASKSQSAHNTLGSDSDDEVMEVDLSTKQQRLIRSTASRASIRRQRAVEEEIMVSFKPVPSPPKGNVEVLIGDRPVSRNVDRENRKISSICREVSPVLTRETQEAFLERLNAVEITIRTLQSSRQVEKTAKDEAKSPEKKVSPKQPQIAPTQEPAEATRKIKSTSKKESEELKKMSSIEKTSPEEISEVSGTRSPTGRSMLRSRSKTSETSSSVRSSSESSKLVNKLTQQEWISSSAEGSCSCQDYISNDESLTITDDSLHPEIKQALENAEKRRQEYLVKYREKKEKSEARMDDPTSPDSESSSSIFTERETSRSEVSTSSSNRVAKSETEEDESSDYVTATDQSPHSPYRLASMIRRKTPGEESDVPTSFESFSSPSKSSGHLQVRSSTSSSSPLPHDGATTPSSQQLEGEAFQEEIQSHSPKPSNDPEDISFYTTAALPPDDLESSDESTKKETPPTTPSTESEGYTPFHKPHHDTSGTPDSDRTSDITPLFDPSPEPLSSLQEPQTVIEIRSEATSEEILSTGNDYDDDEMYKMDDEDSFPKGSGSRSDRGGSESSESSSVLSGLQEFESAKLGATMDPNRLQMGSYPPLDIRKTGDELSTVSEVSEESSKNGVVRVRRKKSDRKASEASSLSEDRQSHFETARGGLSSKRSSSSEYIPSETTTPDSTTSGSFVLDNGSITENDSYNSFAHIEPRSESSSGRVLELGREKEDKIRTESESASESYKDSKSSKTPQPTDEDLLGKHSKSDPERHGASSPLYSASSDLSEKLTSMTVSSSSVSHKVPKDSDTSWERQHSPTQPLSTWCSEGAIPKQRHVEETRQEGRRKKDRIRNRSEPREHVSALQFSRLERSTRSKSRSPEFKLSDDESGVRYPGRGPLCSHCGEKLAHPPLSAPADWDRNYPRFWDMPTPHHHAMMYRQPRSYRDTVAPVGYSAHSRYNVGPYGGSHCHMPRSWSSESAAPEIDLYPEDDEDAGVHNESYRSSSWIYITDSEELEAWRNPKIPREKPDSSSRPPLTRTDSTDSTESENGFLNQYISVTHRMVHRKASVEMYHRIANNRFEVDKRMVIHRNNGEFGFRIHGSKPVVVSYIEKGTPADICGLEIGDIIVSINGLNVLDANHSEVVKLAHSGTEVLKMEVSRTCHVLTPVLSDSLNPPVFSGFLQRLSVSSQYSHKWCRRWFAVKLDGVLYWYKTCEKIDEPLGALALQNQSISRVPEAGAPHAFKVSKFGECPFFFSADDEDTATRWISALNQVAATASRADPYVDECLRNAQLPPISIPNVICQGPLSKLSQRWKAWRKRFFLLKGASLYFYADRNAKVALGLFQLHGYKVQSCSYQGKKNTFEAVPPEPRLKHLYFLADSETDKKRWLAALEYSIDRWIKIG
ncbi:uro-adherence factor A-like isoform X2 [Parasteatoda tepidariorum]